MEYIAYYRVSTRYQKIDGLGIQSQKILVGNYLKSANGTLIAEFVECESGKKSNNRPELQKALTLCKQHGYTLVIANLSRLSRNASFLLNLQDSGICFVCCDTPSVDKFSIGILALIAQKTREDISTNTRNALNALRASGVKLGSPDIRKAQTLAYAQLRRNKEDFAESIRPYIESAKNDSRGRYKTLQDFCDYLKLQNVRTARGLTDWTPSAIANVIRTCETLTLPICETTTKTLNDAVFD
jgi:DNA invertase Pin-like site-specific DNA recombinase